MPHGSDDPTADVHSYFVPMVDMLAGVVFLLVIMLASVTLVSREDFSVVQTAQDEIAAIEAELAAAKAMDRVILQPRRDAEAALRLLLSRLESALLAEGMTAKADPGRSTLTIAPQDLFDPGGARLAGSGERAAATIAAVLARELPCLAPGGAPPTGCAGYPPARLAVASVGTAGGEPGRTELQALQLLASMVGSTPDLLSLRSTDGEALLVYRGLEPGPIDSQENAEPEDAGATQSGIEIRFQMDLPPLPPS